MLEEAVKKSYCYSEVCRIFGIKRPSGGSYELIRNSIKDFDIDTSHFLGRAAYAGMRNSTYNKRKSPNEILVIGHKYRVSHRILKRSLLESGVKYFCNICGLDSWLGKKITLHVDHINGDWSDCTIDNLRFLCPNCHSQTETFGGANIKKEKKEQFFCECGKEIQKRSQTCRNCSDRKKRVVNRPTKDILLSELEFNSYATLAKKYNVSQASIRRWVNN